MCIDTQPEPPRIHPRIEKGLKEHNGAHMRTHIVAISMVCLFMAGASFVTPPATSSDKDAVVLDGMVFVGHVGPVGKAANGEDEIVFQDGLFLSTSCVKYGFGTAPYEAHREGDVIVFSATVKSSKHGQIEWHGTIRGEEIQASYTWTKDRWYWFDANEQNWLKATLKKDL
jgi:hypothetical protein